MKKIFTFCVSLLAALSVFAYDFQSGDLFYNITSSSAPYTVEVTQQSQYYNSNYSGVDTIVIPETVTYNAIIYSVTSIGESAFDHSKLTTITIPNTVTSIGEYAFAYCQKLTSVVIGSGVKTIHMAAFNNCSALRTITIPANVKEIYNQAFTGASISTIYMEGTTPPSLLQSKSDGSAFMIFSTTPTCYVPCSAVASYKASTKWKGAVREFVAEFPYIFTVGSANISLGTIAITQQPDCSTAAIFEAIPNTGCYFTQWSDGNTDNPRTLKVTQDTRLTASFASSTYVVNLIAGANGAVSGAGTYDHGTTATITAIPNDGYHFTQWSDGNTDNPRSIVVVEPISLTALFEENYTQEHCQIIYTSTDGDVVTPWVTYNFGADIVSNTYADGQGVITFDGPVTAIGDTAFANCSSLESIIIPDRVTVIGDQAFQYCTYLKDVTIGNRVESIGTAAFNNCSSLQSITIPQSVKYIYNYAFLGTSVKTVYVNCTNPPLLNPNREDPDLVFMTNAVNTCYIPCGKLESYQVSNWKTKSFVREFIERPSYALLVKSSNNAMGKAIITQDINCESLTAIITAIPNDGYHFIQWSDGNTDNSRSWVVTEDTYLEAIFEKSIDPTWQITYTSTDGNIVTPYATDVFGANIVSNTYENGVGTITFDGPVTSIGYQAFRWCESLTSITIPNSVTSIGYETFDGCSFTSITIPECVNSIGASAFSDCRSLASITIPNSVTSIGALAFMNCYSLSSITIPNGVSSIERYVFANCESLSFVIIPNSVTTIGDYAFEACTSLISVTIPQTVTNVGKCAFRNCKSITSITIPNSVTEIGTLAFGACDSLKSMIVESGNAIYDSRENCNAIIETKTNTLIAGCQNTIIPNSVENIGPSAFWTSISLASITIPNGVMCIGEHAFRYCFSLASITLPETVTSIGESAFEGCRSLTSITIPNSLTSIGQGAFKNCSVLDTIHLEATTPPALKDSTVFMNTPAPVCVIPCGTLAAYEASYWASQVGEFVEEGCIDPTWQITYTSTDGNIVTPYKTNVFGANIVSNTYENGVGTITFDGPVTSIGDDAFEWCSKLRSITIPNGTISIKSGAFYECSSLASITIPESVMSIEPETFINCSSLTSITIPNGVTSVGSQAFLYCSSLTSVTIGNSVSSIGECAFCSGCSSGSSITSIVVEEGNTTYDSRENCNAIIETATNILVVGCQNTIIPNGVTSIGVAAFSCCSKLTSITIPNSVTNIGDEAFDGCSSLTSITIPNSVTSIGDDAFLECESLTSVTIGNSVTSIGKDAFAGCFNLSSITIPNSVTSIGYYAFDGCSSLDTIYVEATTPPALGSGVFTDSPVSTCIIPCGTKAAYEASDWAQYINEFVEEDCVDPTWQILYTSIDSTVVTPYKTDVFGANIVSNEYQDGQGVITFDGPVTCIGNLAFSWCHSLASITIPNSVTSIGDEAFGSCDSLACIILPNSVMSIGERAFNGCYSITSFTIPHSVTSIGNDAFGVCTSLASITIPESVTSIGESVFQYCYSLTSIHVEQGNTIYDSRNNCNAIIETETNTLIAGCQSTIIPNSVTSIGNSAFRHCIFLVSITIPESVTSIGNSAFEGCYDLTSIIIPNSVTSIGDATFHQCYDLTSITLPNSVTSIGKSAFARCSSLTSVSIPSGVTSIEESTFSNCSSLASIIIPNSVTSIGGGAFDYCSSLTAITIPDGVTSIEGSTFSNCSSLTSVTIPNSVTSIGDFAFSYCSSLASITIPKSVTSIGNSAFSSCWMLTSITIPERVTSIEWGAFSHCDSLNTIHIEATTPPIVGDYAFTHSPTCHIPCGTLAAYQVSDWAQYVSEFEEEGCALKVTYELNGGVTNDYGWQSKGAVALELQNDYNAAYGTSKEWAKSENGYIYYKLGEEWVREDLVPAGTDCTTAGFIAYVTYNNSDNLKNLFAANPDKYGWLNDIIIATRTAAGLSVDDASMAEIIYRYELSAFFLCSPERTSWPGTSSYEVAGTFESFKTIWKQAFANPTNPTEEFILNAPYREGYTFAGWYTTPDFSGEKVTTINSETTGTLYAKWIESDHIITYTSTDGNIVTPDEGAFSAAHIVSNEYKDGQGVITFDGPVTSIGYLAFGGCTSLTSITIPNSVTSIGSGAFYQCTSLTSITIPNSVTSIGDWAFHDCSSLTSVTIGSGVNSIGYQAFYQCTSLTSITIPNSVTSIGDWAFYQCTSLTSITIPNSVTSIGGSTFSNCTSLTSATIGSGVKSIGDWAFYQCTSLTSITIPESVTSIGESAFSNCTSLTSVTLGSGVTSIGGSAFYQCTSLTSITIPNSVTSIGYWAFHQCTSLTSVTLGSGVKSIGDLAFGWCRSLTSITIPNSVTSIGVQAFDGCTSLTSITIPNSVTSIGEAAFGGCDSLTTMVVEASNPTYDSRENCNAIIERETNTLIAGCQNTTIPNSVTSIGDSAFYNCNSLTSITIPNSVTSIGSHAFYLCDFTSITIPNSVTSIGDHAFSGCTSLTSVTIGNNVTSIGYSAFYWCPSLTSITCEATTPPALDFLYDTNVFTSSPICHIPCGTLAAYQASDWASQVGEFVEEGCAPIQKCGDDLFWEYADGVLTITGSGDMYDYAVDTDVPWYDVRGNIKTVSLPDAMTKIGQNAFYKCTAMTSINMPTSLTAIGEKAFAQDTKLACEIILPASMTTIASRAFFNCKAVPAFHVEATIPPTVQADAFDYTTAPIHVPCGYGHIYGKHTQWGMLNLEMCELLRDNVYYYPIDGHTARAVTYHSNPADTIVIPSAVVIDGMPRTVTEVADFAFTDCKDIPAIIFNEGLEYIGERAFVRCYGLQGTIVLPATLETIGERAFSYCDNVEKYLIQAMTPPALGDGAFTCANHDALFYVSCEVMDDYKVAARWSSLKSRLRDACLNIYHYNTPLGTNGVYTTEDTLVASIYYRRQFTPYRWETLYLPFEVDRVTVLEDGEEFDLRPWNIITGGDYYLAKPDGMLNLEILFDFTDELETHTPYIIQFVYDYYRDKIITFYGKESWHKLSTSFEVLSSSSWMQIAGNTTMQDQLLEKPVYMLRSGLDFILQKTTTTLHPFECYVMPYTAQSGAPARMNVRFRDDVPTAVESVKGNESRLAYTINDHTLTVYPQGQAFSIYSLNGALIYSCEAGKEAVDYELNSGCYLLHAGTEAHKIML